MRPALKDQLDRVMNVPGIYLVIGAGSFDHRRRVAFRRPEARLLFQKSSLSPISRATLYATAASFVVNS
jgi:hypothetical protein